MIYAVVALMIIFGFRRLLFCMKFMQQDNYYNKRFLRFAAKGLQLLDKHVSIPMLAAAIIGEDWALAIPIAALAAQIIFEKNPSKGAIKPLNITARVKRIFGVAFGLWIMAAAGALIVPAEYAAYYLTALAVLAPGFLMMANFLLVPVEKLINQKFINEAKAKLKKFNPVVVGITGSFGKTSVKNILQHIMESCSTSFATKRSINTLMGIVRAIREDMTVAPKYFVAEIGIADRGQMAEMLRFINPKHGILTAVGAAHLANFKKVETVAREKFRLSQWVGKNNGRTIINALNIDSKFIEKYGNKSDIIFDGGAIERIKQTEDGLSFSLKYDNETHEIFAPVYGRHQAENIAMAFIMARILGAPADGIILALKTLKQTEHRLELRRENGLRILDDSFNSNMSGFLSALKTGAELKGKNKFILITPGIVELGKLHAEQHRIVGTAANELADTVVAVQPERIKDMTERIDKKKLVLADSLAAARKWLGENARENDIVLYENDLPDLYIEKIRI